MKIVIDLDDVLQAIANYVSTSHEINDDVQIEPEHVSLILKREDGEITCEGATIDLNR